MAVRYGEAEPLGYDRMETLEGTDMKRRVTEDKEESAFATLISQMPIWIRHDVWMAFTSLDGRRPVRVYDKEADAALLLAEGAKPGEDEKGGTARFVVIEPISAVEQKAWAKSFVSEIEDAAAKSRLGEILTQERWYHALQKQLEKEPEIGRKWALLKSHRVFQRVVDWINRNNLKIDPLRPKLERKAGTGEKSITKGDADAIRRRVIQAVERMPLHELASLRIPVGYLFE